MVSTGVPPLGALHSGKEVVPVVCSIDASFVPVYSVFLASLLAHTQSARAYDLILLTENVPEDALCAFRAQIRPYSQVSLRCVDMTDYPVPFLDKVGFKKPAFFRLAMPELLPDYPRAVYLDTDTILLHDVAELYDALTHDAFAAAVPDVVMQAYSQNPQVTEEYLGAYGNIGTYWSKHLELAPQARATYFNSGVLVLNLEKMRRAGMGTRFMELLYAKPFVFPDQDILNIAFNGDVQTLPFAWNFFQTLNPKLQYSAAVLAKRAVAAADMRLIHYAWKKPWREAGHVPCEEYFWFYARQSVYYEQLRQAKQKVANTQKFFGKLKRRLVSNPLMTFLKARFPSAYVWLQKIWRRVRNA